MRNHLRKELLQQGASKNEAETLARLGTQLADLKLPGLSVHAKRRMFNRLPFDQPKGSRPAMRWAFAGSLAGAMALLALITLPGILHHTAPTGGSGIKASAQPVETQLKELDTQIEQLQQQPQVDQVQLKQTEDQYKRTLDNFKKHYQNNKQFKNYDWNKWQRSFTTQSYQQDTGSDTHVDGASTTQQNHYWGGSTR